MDNLYKLLTDRLYYLKSFRSLSETYFKHISEIIRGYDTSSYDKFNQGIENLDNHSKNINDILADKHNLTNLVLIYDYFTISEYDLYFMIMIVRSTIYIDILSNQMSQTFIDNIYLQRNNIENVYNTYHLSYSKDMTIFKSVEEFDDMLELRKIINNIEYKSGNRLITYFISKVLETSKGEERQLLQNRVENLKDDILCLKLTQKDIKQWDAIAYLLVRYNLLPVSRVDSMENILKEYLVPPPDLSSHEVRTDTNNSLLTGMITYLLKKYTVIIINKITKNPIIFDSLPLIDTKYIVKHNLLVSEISGLTNKVLNRYNNVIRYTGLSTTDKPSIEYHVNKLSNVAIIFETLDGINYRILSDKLGTITVSADLAKKISLGSPMRPMRYNNIIEETILDRCLDNKLIGIRADFDDYTRKPINMDALKKSIVDKLLIRFDKISRLNDNTEYSNFVLDKKITFGIIGSYLYHVYDINRNDAEQATSFIKVVDGLLNLFYKELINAISENPILDRIYIEKSETALKEYLRGHYKNLLELSFADEWRNIEVLFKDFVLERRLKR